MKKGFWYILAIVLVTAFSSCDKDENKPDYIGKWTGTSDIILLGVNVTETIILTENTFDVLFNTAIGTMTTELGGVKGSMTVSGNSISITVTSAGVIDEESYTIVWYDSNSDEFAKALENVGKDATMDATYSVSGKTLTLTIDGVTRNYTKVE